MTQLALPLVSAFLAFVAGLLFGLRAEWVTGGIALTAVPLLLAPWLHRRLIGEPIRADSVRLLLLGATISRVPPFPNRCGETKLRQARRLRPSCSHGGGSRLHIRCGDALD